jgi:hypothetical protein
MPAPPPRKYKKNNLRIIEEAALGVNLINPDASTCALATGVVTLDQAAFRGSL